MWHEISHARRGFAVTLLLAWMAAVVAAFWWFEFRWIREVGVTHADAPEWRALLPEGAEGRVAVMSFVDPACPCSEAAAEALAELRERFAAAGVVVGAVVPAGGRELAIRQGWPTPVRALEQDAPGEVMGGPAVMIWGADGRLAYAGPMALGGHCGGGVEALGRMVQAVLAGGRPGGAVEKASCACAWPAKTQDWAG